MKWKFTLLVCLAISASFIGRAQADGDYRSAAIGTGLWSNPASWEVYESASTSWVGATTFPTSANTNRITIRSGDSIILNQTITIDDVEVEGTLAIFIATGTFTVTLNDGLDDDLVVSSGGSVQLALGAILNGPGNVVVNAGGRFYLRNAAVLSAPLLNSGTLRFPTVGAVLLNTTVTNNGECYWTDGGITVNNSSILNNDLFSITHAASPIMSTVGTSSFTNAVGGQIVKTGATGVAFTQVQVPFTNQGEVSGVGNLYFLSVTSNTGNIAPGFSPGIMSTTTGMINGQPTTLNIELTGTSGTPTPGTDNDQILVRSAAPAVVSLANTTLNLIGLEDAPLGTQYTIMASDPAGGLVTFTGTFAAITGNGLWRYTVTVLANSVVVTKTATLPLTWGEFNAIAQDNSKVLLKWSTLQETNTSHFVVEFSKNGTDYIQIGTLNAQGNSDRTTNYSFQFDNPDTRAVNYFRIRQLDIDGRSSLSPIRHVRFDKGSVVPVTAYPNPVRDRLTLNVQTRNISVQLHSFAGTMISSRTLQPGQHQIDMSMLPAGFYQLSVFEDGKRIDMLKIVKQ